MQIDEQIEGQRPRNYGIDPIFIERWSPRAVSSENVEDEDLWALFEAARWAPSSYNEQFWRFIIARDDDDREKFISSLSDWNQKWAGNAPVLALIIAKQTFDKDGREAPTNQFDTGAAWENLALEANNRDMVAHAMQGFDNEQIRYLLNIPRDYDILAMVAIGYKGDIGELPDEIEDKEKISSRLPLSKLVFEGRFENKIPDLEN